MARFQPFVIGDPYAVVKQPMLAVAELAFGAVHVVRQQVFMPGLSYCVHDTCVLAEHIRPAENASVQDVISRLKKQILEHGGSPGAVFYLHQLAPFTRKELDMAKDKLATKGAPKETAAKPPKAKAETAGTKPKGNAAALEKARAARAEAGPDTRKIKIVNKENPYRAESNRAASFDALKGAKTVEDYKTAGGKVKYLSRWVEEKRIELA